MPQAKTGLKTAKLANRGWRPQPATKAATTPKTANRKSGSGSRGRKKTVQKRNSAPVQSTALARRPATTTAAKTANRTPTPKKVVNKRRNGLITSRGGWQVGSTKLTANPSFGEFGAMARIAFVGFSGGMVSKGSGAILLAVIDRFAPKYSGHMLASPAATLLAALFLTPRLFRYMGFRDEATLRIATTGGILYATFDLVDAIIGVGTRDEFITSIRQRVTNIIPGKKSPEAVANSVAETAQTNALAAGASPAQAQAVALKAGSAVLSGLRGGGNLAGVPYPRNGGSSSILDDDADAALWMMDEDDW